MGYYGDIDSNYNRYMVLFELADEKGGINYLVRDTDTNKIFKASYDDLLIETMRFHVIGMTTEGFGKQQKMVKQFDKDIPKVEYHKLIGLYVPLERYYILGNYIGAKLFYPFKNEITEVCSNEEVSKDANKNVINLMHKLHMGEVSKYSSGARDIELIHRRLVSGENMYISTYNGENKAIRSKIEAVITKLNTNDGQPKFEVIELYVNDKEKTIGYCIRNISNEVITLDSITTRPGEIFEIYLDELNRLSIDALSNLVFTNAMIVDNRVSKYIRSKNGYKIQKLYRPSL